MLHLQNQAMLWKLFLSPSLIKSVTMASIWLNLECLFFFKEEGGIEQNCLYMGSNTQVGLWLLQLDVSPLAPHYTPREKGVHFILPFPTAIFLQHSCSDHGVIVRDET